MKIADVKGRSGHENSQKQQLNQHQRSWSLEALGIKEAPE